MGKGAVLSIPNEGSYCLVFNHRTKWRSSGDKVPFQNRNYDGLGSDFLPFSACMEGVGNCVSNYPLPPVPDCDSCMVVPF